MHVHLIPFFFLEMNKGINKTLLGIIYVQILCYFVIVVLLIIFWLSFSSTSNSNTTVVNGDTLDKDNPMKGAYDVIVDKDSSCAKETLTCSMEVVSR